MNCKVGAQLDFNRFLMDVNANCVQHRLLFSRGSEQRRMYLGFLSSSNNLGIFSVIVMCSLLPDISPNWLRGVVSIDSLPWATHSKEQCLRKSEECCGGFMGRFGGQKNFGT